MLRIKFFDSKCLWFILSSMVLCGFSSSHQGAIGALVKNTPPPCEVPEPTFDFMREDTLPFSVSNMTSAAWFARQVQMTSGLRNEAWKNLTIKPEKITDFEAAPWGLHVTLLEFEQQILVLYRGTEDVLDYALNATFYTTNSGAEVGLPGWVHQGFLVNFRLTWERVFEALKEATRTGKSIVFAAHSLGGVLSQYAALLAEDAGLKVVRVYAFQSPNPGDAHFKKTFEERFKNRHSNTIYGDDVTPHIPPIKESAEAFEGAALQPFAKLLSKWLKVAHYATLDERFLITSSGERVKIPSESVVQSEIEYWNSYKKKSGGRAFPMGLNSESTFIADHDIDRVLCALAKIK